MNECRRDADRLPVAKYRRHLLYLVETHATVIVLGETGSGKTTQIPQYLHEAGECLLLVASCRSFKFVQSHVLKHASSPPGKLMSVCNAMPATLLLLLEIYSSLPSLPKPRPPASSLQPPAQTFFLVFVQDGQRVGVWWPAHNPVGLLLSQ